MLSNAAHALLFLHFHEHESQFQIYQQKLLLLLLLLLLLVHACLHIACPQPPRQVGLCLSSSASMPQAAAPSAPSLIRVQGQLSLVQELLVTDLWHALNDVDEAKFLVWRQRGKEVALDVARGLAYLHTTARIIHLDLKYGPGLAASVKGTLWMPKVLHMAAVLGAAPTRLLPG